MTKEIQEFTQYLKEVRRTSENTTISYERDLKKMDQYFAGQGIEKAEQITLAGLNAYILFLERQGKKPAKLCPSCRKKRHYVCWNRQMDILPRNYVIGQ